VPTAHISTK